MVIRSRVGPVAQSDIRPPMSRGIDLVASGRGIWRGFVVLVIGALLQPIAAAVAPVAGATFLLITAIVAFAIAGFRTGDALSPILHGAVTAVGSYVLVLPLVFITSGLVWPQQVLATVGVAVAAGGFAGFAGHLVHARRKQGGRE
ncbi:hypothetical protein SAMN05216266_11743 [Amycolatopsis marina]|uniref:Uncharacterized protein n=1 Tax=Amycolatopsis marina TaxID=490629 RepID=A0A1I1BSM1_9PSEU|nr:MULTISPECIES: hypothetical protein [Amycolatopsis]SFB53444.1 hypothetical protein SAMN05216266_11743 [Amycolatopsis marina]